MICIGLEVCSPLNARTMSCNGRTLQKNHFIRPRPDCNEIILLPDYIDDYLSYTEKMKRKTKVMKQMDHGYIQVPMVLADKYGLFHQAINDESIPAGVYVWAVASFDVYSLSENHLPRSKRDIPSCNNDFAIIISVIFFCHIIVIMGSEHIWYT